MNRFLIAAVLTASFGFAGNALAQETVTCESDDYQYTECYAGRLSDPVLIHQISNSSCIMNRSWGFNRRTGRLWVANGCAGTFSDNYGYYHGREGSYDNGARHYHHDGSDAGEIVGGAVLGALLGAVLSDSDDSDNDDYRRPDRVPSNWHRCSDGAWRSDCRDAPRGY